MQAIWQLEMVLRKFQINIKCIKHYYMHMLMYEAGTKADIQTNNSRWDLILEVQKDRLKDKRIET
jgi:hypothetical protein